MPKKQKKEKYDAALHCMLHIHIKINRNEERGMKYHMSTIRSQILLALLSNIMARAGRPSFDG